MQNFYIEHNLMDNRALILSKMKQKPSTVTPINQSPVNPSPVVNPSTSDGADDGKISFKEKLKNFVEFIIKRNF